MRFECFVKYVCCTLKRFSKLLQSLVNLSRKLEELRVNTHRLVRLMGTTFLWGGLAGLIVGLVLSIQDPALELWSMGDWVFGVIGWFGGGLIFSALSMLGFFAYSLINQLGLGLFRKPMLWNALLILLMVITFYDTVELRYAFFAEEGESYYSYVLFPLILFLWGLLVSFIKAKDTNKSAFIPTLFFMFSFTILELIPALRQDNIKSLLDMAIPLVVANSWQVLIFHRILKDPKLESSNKVMEKREKVKATK